MACIASVAGLGVKDPTSEQVKEKVVKADQVQVTSYPSSSLVTICSTVSERVPED